MYLPMTIGWRSYFAVDWTLRLIEFRYFARLMNLNLNEFELNLWELNLLESNLVAPFWFDSRLIRQTKRSHFVNYLWELIFVMILLLLLQGQNKRYCCWNCWTNSCKLWKKVLPKLDDWNLSEMESNVSSEPKSRAPNWTSMSGKYTKHAHILVFQPINHKNGEKKSAK